MNNLFEKIFSDPFDYTDFDNQLEKITLKKEDTFIKKIFNKLFNKKDKSKQFYIIL